MSDNEDLAIILARLTMLNYVAMTLPIRRTSKEETKDEQ
jgi:hypothetical protein